MGLPGKRGKHCQHAGSPAGGGGYSDVGGLRPDLVRTPSVPVRLSHDPQALVLSVQAGACGVRDEGGAAGEVAQEWNRRGRSVCGVQSASTARPQGSNRAGTAVARYGLQGQCGDPLHL